MAKSKIASERAPGTFTLVPLFLFVIVTLLGWWYATQMVAQALGYQQQLGTPIFVFSGIPIYYPWQVVVWNYWFHSYATPQFNHAMLYVFGSVGAGVASVFVYVVWLARRGAIATTYGSARWGTKADIKDAGLFSDTGVVLGVSEDGKYIIHNGPEHVCSIAPPRTGKGVGQIIPTLLIWPGSVVVNDTKGENWEATAGYRLKFSNVIYFNPCSTSSARFNPLLEVRQGLNQIKDVQNIADMLVNPEGKEKLDHWEKTGHNLLVGSILHVLHAEKDKSLAGVASFLSDPRRGIVDTLLMMMSTPYPDTIARTAIQSAAREMLNKSPNELSGVLSTAMSFLGLYRDPVVAMNTSSSDFRIIDLMQADKPLSLYLVIPPSDISRVRSLLRLMWSQIGRRLTEELNPTDNKHRLLLLMDEFPVLGRMEFFDSALAYIPGYGIKAFIVAQSKNQLDAAYGANNSILDTCHVKAVYTPGDEKSAEVISSMTGTTTGVHQQKTYTGHRLAPWLAHIMIADQEVARPLLTVGEVLTFPDDEALIFVAGKSPIRIKKLRYYEDGFFMNRVFPVPDITGHRVYPYRPKQRPNQWTSFIQQPVMPLNNTAADPNGEPLADDDVEAFDINQYFDSFDQDMDSNLDVGDKEAADISNDALNIMSNESDRRAQFSLLQDLKDKHRPHENGPDLDMII